MTPDRPAAISSRETTPSDLRPPAGAWRDRILSALDAFAFSSGLPAAIAGALTLTASLLMQAPSGLRWAALAAAGTFVVYTLDRLRDIERDRSTAPLRTQFIEHNRERLILALGVAALAVAGTLAVSPFRVGLLCVAIGAVGLLHRRLKTIAVAKTLYVSLAWTATCVGLPRLAVDTAPEAVWIAAILLPTITANLIASNLRDDENQILRGRPARVLWIARAIALAGVVLAVAAPGALPALGWVPLAELAALGAYRRSERFGHIVIDGALLAGALAALVQLG